LPENIEGYSVAKLVCLAADCGSKDCLFRQLAATKYTALPTVNADQLSWIVNCYSGYPIRSGI